MSKYTELMLKYSDGELELKEAFQLEKIILANQDLKKEYLLNQRLDECMRVQLMIQQIQNDPDLPDIESISKKAVNNYILNEGGQDQNIAFFINGAVAQNKEMEEMINGAEREMYLCGIEKQTLDWVKNWKEQSKDYKVQDKYTRELIDYVKLGMNESSNPEFRIVDHNLMKRKRFLVYLSSVAAVIIIAFGIWGIFNFKTNPNELFTEYYQPYKIIDGQTRSIEPQVNNKFKKAAKLYENGNFSEAGELFNELLIIDANSAKIKLLYGISQLEEKQYESAILNFKGVINNNGEYLIEAKWYLAMTYLKTKDIKSAKLLLKELAEIPGYYKDKSRKILEKL